MTSVIRSQVVALYRQIFGEPADASSVDIGDELSESLKTPLRSVNLPNEILITIFLHLALRDLVTCRRVRGHLRHNCEW